MIGIVLLISVLHQSFGHAKNKDEQVVSCTTRQQYRKSLGKLIEKDQDVYHIIASSNGGADHGDNYDLGRGSGWNRAIGNNYDHINCYLAGREKCKKAVAVSRMLGSHTCTPTSPKAKKYDGPSAEVLYKMGEDAWRDFRAHERSRKKEQSYEL